MATQRKTYRDVELPLVADHHELHSLGPPADDLVRGEGGGTTTACAMKGRGERECVCVCE